jgi:hypothetical protein
MPIDPDFPKNHQVIGKHNHANGEHYHFVWGPGRTYAETSTKPEFRKHTKQEKNLIMHWEFMVRWLPLIGIPVMQTVLV